MTSSRDAPLAVTAIAASAELGGTERVLLDFATRAFEFDVTLRVVTPRHGPLVSLLNESGVPCAVVPAPGALLRASQRTGHLLSVVPAVAGVWQWARRLGRHEFVREADVVYTQGYKPHLAAGLARLHPVVWHLHEFPPRATGRFWKWMARRLPEALIANSDAAAAAWASAARARLTVVHNGVDLDRFRPRPRTGWIHDTLGIPQGHRLIGMPAVFARWKGQLQVLDAFGQIARAFPTVHLVFVGGTIYDTVSERAFGDVLRAAVQAAAWPPVSGERDVAAADGADIPRVHVLPFQSEIERVYPELDLTVHYSLRPEPFGRVVVEAMACGVPVIAAGEGGPVEILGPGDGVRRGGGWLAPPRDPRALARVFEEALRLSSSALGEVGALARRRAEDAYSSRRFARRVAEVLRSAR